MLTLNLGAIYAIWSEVVHMVGSDAVLIYRMIHFGGTYWLQNAELWPAV